jgi:hypothetical protein
MAAREGRDRTSGIHFKSIKRDVNTPRRKKAAQREGARRPGRTKGPPEPPGRVARAPTRVNRFARICLQIKGEAAKDSRFRRSVREPF